MMRRLLTLLTLLSLMLCAAVVAMWVRSYFWIDDLGVSTVAKSAEFRRDRQFQFETDGGGAEWVITTYEFNSSDAIGEAEFTRPASTTVWRNVFESTYDSAVWRGDWVGGFWYRHDQHQPGKPGMSFRSESFRTPFWFLLAVASVPLVVRAMVFLRTSRRLQVARVGHCVRCGYDLRATPGRCPECGSGREGARVESRA
jgi:hypothetical protein